MRKINFKNLLGLLLGAIIFFSLNLSGVDAADLREDSSKSWVWETYEVDGVSQSFWAYYDAEGRAKEQFYKENGKTWLSIPQKGYYRGWWTNPENNLTYYFRESSGSMVTGWQYIDGNWRFFRESGSLVTSRWEWLENRDGSKSWKYFDENGISISRFYADQFGTWLSKSGPYQGYHRGWWIDPDNNQKYFFRLTSGSRVEGWQYIDGDWRFFRKNSATLATDFQYINGYWYYLSGDFGSRTEGWAEIGNYWYFFRLHDGSRVSGRQYIDGKWHYFDNEGICASKSFEFVGFLNSEASILESEGGEEVKSLGKDTLIEGNYTKDGKYIMFLHYGDIRYVDAELVSQNTDTGLFSKGLNKYYIVNGQVSKGWTKIGSNTYYFDPMLGYMYKGVKNTGVSIYYFNEDGSLSIGDKTIYGTHDIQNLYFSAPTNTELSNSWLSNDQRCFLGQAAVNTALTAIGTKYQWYGLDLKEGLYCSGLAYTAYKNNGIIIPGPEYGNLEEAMSLGPQSGRVSRGWGPVGLYGYKMAEAQYLKTQDYSGVRLLRASANLNPGDLVFARGMEFVNDLEASHTAIYAGLLNGKPMIIHSGFAGTFLDPISLVVDIWGYPLMDYIQRPYWKSK